MAAHAAQPHPRFTPHRRRIRRIVVGGALAGSLAATGAVAVTQQHTVTPASASSSSSGSATSTASGSTATGTSGLVAHGSTSASNATTGGS